MKLELIFAVFEILVDGNSLLVKALGSVVDLILDALNGSEGVLDLLLDLIVGLEARVRIHQLQPFNQIVVSSDDLASFL